jgi:hypothetical protein
LVLGGKCSLQKSGYVILETRSNTLSEQGRMTDQLTPGH